MRRRSKLRRSTSAAFVVSRISRLVFGPATNSADTVVLPVPGPPEPTTFVGTRPSISAVYFVVLQGEFEDTQAYLPPGAPAPMGMEIDFTIDPTTHRILDFGISDQIPDVAALGTPITVSWLPAR
jgi:hypothetical protein